MEKENNKRMDIEEIVDTLAREEINKVKWSGKMPEGVSGVWKEYPSSRPGDLYADGIRPYSTEYVIRLTDRVNYDAIKKICDNDRLTVYVKDAEINEKRKYPINYSIYDEKNMKMEELHVDSNIFSFYISSESVRVKGEMEDVPEYVTARKRGKKALKVIKTYLSKVYGGN